MQKRVNESCFSMVNVCNYRNISDVRHICVIARSPRRGNLLVSSRTTIRDPSSSVGIKKIRLFQSRFLPKNHNPYRITKSGFCQVKLP